MIKLDHRQIGATWSFCSGRRYLTAAAAAAAAVVSVEVSISFPPDHQSAHTSSSSPPLLVGSPFPPPSCLRTQNPAAEAAATGRVEKIGKSSASASACAPPSFPPSTLQLSTAGCNNHNFALPSQNSSFLRGPTIAIWDPNTSGFLQKSSDTARSL